MSSDAATGWTLENPTQRNAVSAVLLGTYAIVWFATAEVVVWRVAAAGFVAFAIGSGPVGAAVGTKLGTWIDGIGTANPVATVVAVVGIVSVVFVSLDVSLPVATSFAHGGALGAVATVATEVIRSRVASNG